MCNHSNEFILHKKRWLISKCKELEIGLQFECNGFDTLNNFSEGSSESKKHTQVIRVAGAAVIELELLVPIS